MNESNDSSGKNCNKQNRLSGDSDNDGEKNKIPQRIKYKPGHGMSRYNTALGNLILFRPKAQAKKTMPIDKVGLFSYIYMTWITSYVWKAFRKGISLDDLPTLSPYDTCSYNSQRLEILWKEELKRRGSDSASFGLVVWKFVRTRILVSSALQLLTLVFGLLTPMFIMRKILENVQSTQGSILDGIKWVLLLALCEILRTAFFTSMHVANYRTGMRLRSACLVMLYKKIVNLNNLGGKTTGEFIAMFSNDGQRMYDLVVFGPMIVSAPIIVVATMIYILCLLNPVALTGLIAFFAFYGLQYITSRTMRYLKTNCIKMTDIRLRNISEILDCIKLIKIQALEEFFTQNILDVRNLEKKWLYRIVALNSVNTSLVQVVSTISAIVTFLAYLLTSDNLTAAEAFSLVMCFGNVMKQSLAVVRDGTVLSTDARIVFARYKVFPLLAVLNTQVRSSYQYVQPAITNIIDAIITYERIKKVLLMEENTTYAIKPIVRFQAISIVNGRFVCDKHESRNTLLGKAGKKRNIRANEDDGIEALALKHPEQEGRRVELLSDITFEATKGKLIGICGQVGSGKSSLLLAALGQLKMTSGQMMRDGSFAFVGQQAWIVNASFRENILFGETFDSNRYYRALSICCLKDDLNVLPAGDETEIGERGVNLSGGQKQRIALARSFYVNRDIYLLDDPLSAVDAYVGLQIFENLILKALINKTVVFVTHQVQYLNRCNDIYVMRNGRIVEHGSHDDLMHYDREYAFIVKSMTVRTESLSDDSQLNSSAESKIPSEQAKIAESAKEESGDVKSDEVKGSLIEKEVIESGGISSFAYQTYVKAVGGKYFIFATVLMFFLNVGSNTFSNWWLAVWIKAGSGNAAAVGGNGTKISDNLKDNPDFWFYYWVYAACIGVILLTTLLRSSAVTYTTIGASTKLHNSVLQKVMAAPIKFFETTPSGRILNIFSSDIDEIDNKLPISLESIVQNLLIFGFSIFLISMVFVWYIFPFLILGTVFLYIIRVFRVAARDIKRLESSLRSPMYSFVSMTTQGLSTIQAFNKENDFIKRFEDIFDQHGASFFLYNLVSRWLAVRFDSLTVISTCVIALFVVCLRGYVAPAFAGLAMVYGSQISGIFQYTIRVLSEVEVRFISVERICFYLRTLVDENFGAKDTIEPPESWPSGGKIEYENLSLRYGKDSQLALNDVSFVVDAGEKIGIVGRTGSGKSSLVASLLRLFEPETGSIKIDGIDISGIHLSTLRHKMTIIPQDSVLFTGNIRSYLDPRKSYKDEEIWEALEKTRMKERVSSAPAQLEFPIDNNGAQFSMGEKQLLCLTRAILHRNKILVLDEATASMDLETEATVHQAIENEFKECTIMVIAHRLQNVLSCDRILVLSNGRIVEFDTPEALLTNPDSNFSKMLAAMEEATKN